MIPDGVASIADHAFLASCESVTSVKIPDSGAEIGNNAFDCCKSLTFHAPAGSFAEQFAKKNKIPFEAI